MYEELAMYIDGEWCQGSDGAGEDVINPATEETLARLPHASSADLDRALAAASRGFAEWRATSCLLYTSPSPRDVEESRMPSSA